MKEFQRILINCLLKFRHFVGIIKTIAQNAGYILAGIQCGGLRRRFRLFCTGYAYSYDRRNYGQTEIQAAESERMMGLE